ncbi:MAG TPA: carboxymuconolactone decarboxylase family protein [Candidatus Solibacter sp.]|nr:carboxymuconolactone decarboxylase family protein [Candidatus Solibacter sp.]
MLLPEAMQALYALGEASKKGTVPQRTLDLVHLRASQINGCSVCVDMHGRELKRSGETDIRLIAVAAWRDAPYFSDAERSALELTEAATRIADRSDPISDQVWNEATKHYNDLELAQLVLHIGLINFWNRLNVATRQIAGEWLKSAEAQQHSHAAQASGDRRVTALESSVPAA